MFNRASAFNQFRTLFAPRKPRHPLVRVAVGLLGLAILAAMVFIGVFVGAAMILVGLAWKLLASRKPGWPVRSTRPWSKASTAWYASRCCRPRADPPPARPLTAGAMRSRLRARPSWMPACPMSPM